MIPYIISGNVVSLVIDNKPVTIDQYHVNFSNIKESIKKGDWENVKKMAMVSIVDVINNSNGLYVDIKSGMVKYKDYALPDVLVHKILEMVKGNYALDHLLKFIDNLFLNPSYKTVQELYSFLEVGKLPITEDGCFLAYKKVNPDFTSIHDSKTRNDVGTVVKMDRNMVDDNSSNTCSYGLHFCSYDYLKHFGDENSKVLILKVNPSMVVSIPKDYNDTKGRACEYLVLSEVGNIKMDEPLVDTSDYGLKDLEKDFDPYFDADGDFKSYDVAYHYGYDIGCKSNIEMDLDDYQKLSSLIHGDIFEKGFLDGKKYLNESGEYSNQEYYNRGYSDGRNKMIATLVNDFYLQGYKDGKNHRPKKVV